MSSTLHYITSTLLPNIAIAAIATLIGLALGAPKSKNNNHGELAGLLGILLTLSLFIDNFFIIVICSLIFGKILGKTIRLRKNTNQDTNTPNHELGSAAWERLSSLKGYKEIFLTKGGLILGEICPENYLDMVLYQVHSKGKSKASSPESIRESIYYHGNRHLLTVAPTRSGKGVSTVIPNLLAYEGSCLVIDPKGENARITGVRRGSGDPSHNIPGLGQTVHVVDPWGITGHPIACFNPLDWLQADDIDINENAMMLADSIIVPSGDKDRFWDEEAKALLMGLLLYVALDPREEYQKHLGRVRDIIVMSNTDFALILDQMSESHNLIVRSTAARTASKQESLRANVLASLQANTHFLDSPRIRENLSKSDFYFEDLKFSPTTIYLVLPADRLDTFGRWLRLLVQQAITVNARNITHKPAKPILFLLDEMSALGRLSMVEQAYSLMAGFGMQLWGIIQDLSQLERIYGSGWETFIGNSGVLQYFGSRDNKTASYFSKLCGVTTIQKKNHSTSIAETLGFSQAGDTEGTTTTESSSVDIAQRSLIYPDELMRLGNARQILLIENLDPIKGYKKYWYLDDEIKNLGINLNN